MTEYVMKMPASYVNVSKEEMMYEEGGFTCNDPWEFIGKAGELLGGMLLLDVGLAFCLVPEPVFSKLTAVASFVGGGVMIWDSVGYFVKCFLDCQ